MTDEHCGATGPNPRRPGHKRQHLGRHVCVAGQHASLWHRCWCGVQWGPGEDE